MSVFFLDLYFKSGRGYYPHPHQPKYANEKEMRHAEYFKGDQSIVKRVLVACVEIIIYNKLSVIPSLSFGELVLKRNRTFVLHERAMYF